ncbi:aminotransferase class V-fold PLP-dependent enzyme [Vibrio sp. Hep-1b-8]|uniref:pyridoxal-phosphate-dependent aminotransferase family protein n=1 Tax=Vibrio sp. Hep-1b-8 TaxID=2144187 RepID=UPI001486761E|nr:aminotransferase class V-fold PLP-dependent enzyme [Vibrio sp. Hep-1b-8]
MSEGVLKAGSLQAEYFRDSGFANKVLTIQSRLLDLVRAEPNSKVAIISSSGTAAMEAAVTNFTKKSDRVIAINGGSFGERFVDLLKFYDRNVEEHKVPFGQDIDLLALEKQLCAIRPRALFINAHETSTGQLYNLKEVGALCKKHDVLFICDAISSIACDPYDMSSWGINVTLFSSNKGLGLSPGLGFVVVDEKAQNAIQCNESYYLDLKRYFDGYDRGQPPFTSSVSVLMQLIERFNEIDNLGGLDKVIEATKENATQFRTYLVENGIELFPQTPSNAISAFSLHKGNSEGLYDYLKSKGMLINKSAWGLGKDIPRISHAGNLTKDDHVALQKLIVEYIKDVH